MAKQNSDRQKPNSNDPQGTAKTNPNAAGEIPRRPAKPTTKPKSDNT